jgi:hypothetical protein
MQPIPSSPPHLRRPLPSTRTHMLLLVVLPSTPSLPHGPGDNTPLSPLPLRDRASRPSPTHPVLAHQPLRTRTHTSSQRRTPLSTCGRLGCSFTPPSPLRAWTGASLSHPPSARPAPSLSLRLAGAVGSERHARRRCEAAANGHSYNHSQSRSTQPQPSSIHESPANPIYGTTVKPH